MRTQNLISLLVLATVLQSSACSSSNTQPKGAAGASSDAGASSTGGTSAGGSGPGVQCKNLPAATGSDGIAKPAGNAGNLKVVNWAGFKGAVTYTFDDANSSQISNYATLNGLGVHLTFYLITSKTTEMNSPVWPQAVTDGHELGNHTQTHNTISAADIDAATTFIQQKFGVTPYTFAAPNGTNGPTGYEQYASTRFLIDRGVSNALIMPNDGTDQWNLPCYIPPTGAAASVFNTQIDSAESGGGWRVVLVHGFTGGTDGAYQPVDIAEFTAGVNHAKSLGDLWIDTMANIGSYWVGQKLVAKASAATSGNDQIWTWTWPAIYPPNSCVRVTVDGGTLKQNGSELPWDGHGYYEVSLDAGALTLSP